MIMSTKNMTERTWGSKNEMRIYGGQSKIFVHVYVWLNGTHTFTILVY
jgi:hypothetical protein